MITVWYDLQQHSSYVLGVTIWNLQNDVGTNLRQKSTIWNEKESKIQIT